MDATKHRLPPVRNTPPAPPMFPPANVQAVLIEQANASIGKMPENLVEMHRMLWDAFKRGREYERVRPRGKLEG